VRTRRRTLARQAAGRVLDLGGADSHRSLWTENRPVDAVVALDGAGDAELVRLARSGQRFDTIFSVFQFAAAPDLAATLARVGQLLGDQGRILFVEPGRLSGAPGRAQRLVAPAVGLVTGWHVDRDVPMAMRRSGLSVTDLDRHRTGTTQWWLRSIVEGSAHRSLLPGRHVAG
jgi:SAM-dependent methyltransferase